MTDVLETPATPETANSTGQQTATRPNVLPLPEDGVNSLSAWKIRVQSAFKVIDDLKPSWDANQQRFLGKKSGDLKDVVIVVPDAFAHVEQKKAIMLQAISQRVAVEAKLDGLESAAQTFEAVINHYLSADSPECVNAQAACDEVLSDALCPSGIFAVKIGYIPFVDGVKQVQVGEQPDPNWKPSIQEQLLAKLNIAPLPQPPMVPVFKDVPNIIYQKYVFERISPTDILKPSEFRQSDYDRASWLAMAFDWDLEEGKKRYNLPADFEGTPREERRIGESEPQFGSNKTRKRITGVEIYYKAYLFDPKVKHPEKQRCLVLIDGLDYPVEHKDSPYQKQLPDGTLVGMPGFPIHIGALRYVSDMAHPPSDCEILKHQVNEKSRHRSAQLLNRERSVPQRLANKTALGNDGLAKLEKNITQAIIPVEVNEGDQLDVTKLVAAVPIAHYPQENFQFENYVNADLEKASALNSNQLGATTLSKRSATETAVASTGSGTRMEKEIERLIAWHEKGIRKLASLIQMFADEKAYVRITGPGGVKKTVAWDKTTISGEYAFSITTDIANNQKLFLQYYNLGAASPNVNRLELDTIAVRKFGMDPDKLIKTEEQRAAEQPQPEKPDLKEIDLNGLNPNNPAFPIYVAILRERGFVIPDSAIVNAQKAGAVVTTGNIPVAGADAADPQEPNPMTEVQPAQPDQTGSAEKVQPLDKHQMQRSGEMTGPRVGMPEDDAA